MKTKDITLKQILHAVAIIFIVVVLISFFNMDMYVKEKISYRDGLNYYYTGKDFWNDLSKMERDYNKCYSNKEENILRLESPYDIKMCNFVDCEDFAYSSKLLAEQYGFKCKYMFSVNSDFENHKYIKCYINRHWVNIGE